MKTDTITDSNTNITTNILGLGNSTSSSELERSNIITWARGWDTTNSPHYFSADFIHSQPAIVTYHTDNSTPNNPTFDDTLYAASNIGFIHAIDTTDGKEQFSFIPQELLPNLTTYYQNRNKTPTKTYGLDAPMTIWRNDNDGDGSIVTKANGTFPDIDKNGNTDHVYLYQGMRRGGKNIYALDVTDRSNPVLLWQIKGGNNGTAGFEKLGQTWSTPQLGRIKLGGIDTDVLLFGGGYDSRHDTLTTLPPSDDAGSAIYMVNARTGHLMWSADNTSDNFKSMNNSFPANITSIDLEGDGYTDLLIAVDIKGTVWRIDFPSSSTDAADFFAKTKGGAIAKLGGKESNFRRFYNAPDIAYFSPRGKPPFLTISISSGYRAKPKTTSIKNHLFVIFDDHILTAPDNYNYINGTRIINISDLSTSSGAATNYGWNMAIGNPGDGEKGLSRTITLDGKIMMTTFTPDITTHCHTGIGKGKFYLLDALNGESRLKIHNGNSINYLTLARGGIPPRPVVIFGTKEVCVKNCTNESADKTMEQQSNVSICIGTECIDEQVDLALRKTYWRENK